MVKYYINFNEIGSLKLKLLSGNHEHFGQNVKTVYPHKHSLLRGEGEDGVGGGGYKKRAADR